MLSLMDWPSWNASLNGLTTLLLSGGYWAIKTRRVPLHRALMGSAFLSSTIFLGSYLAYHAQVGATRFAHQGFIRLVYFFILISHTILATAIVPLVLATVFWALRANFEKHKRWARWTWPLWMYVSVTGVLVYALLYHW